MTTPIEPGPLAHPSLDLAICDEPSRLASCLLNPPLSRLLAEWQGFASKVGLPSRQDFPPENLRYILGNLILLDVERDADGGIDFRYRLFGSHFAYQRGFDLTGKLLRDYPVPEIVVAATSGYTMMIKTGQPMLGRFGSVDSYGQSLLSENITVPLSDDGITVNRLLGGQFNRPLDSDLVFRRKAARLLYGEPDALRLCLQHPNLQRLLCDWERWRGKRAMPSRADFQPEDLHYLLGNLFLFDVEPAATGPRFRYRLFGSGVAAFRGFDLTGRLLDEHPDASFAAAAARAYAPVAQAQRPLWADVNSIGNSGMSFRFEALVLPLSSDGKTVDMALSAQIMR